MEVKLFTPGPVQTSDAVRSTLQKDTASRDNPRFRKRMDFVRKTLCDIADPSKTGKYTTILLPGTGSYAMESIFLNVIGKTSNKALILSNGAFGDRMLEICSQGDYNYDYLKFDVDDFLPLNKIESHLMEHGSEYSLISFVHSETSTGVINPISEIAALVKRYSNAYLFVDAMSSFGAISVDMEAYQLDFVVSTTGKCLQGIPGLSFIICKLDSFKACYGRCPSYSFDLEKQWTSQELAGNFRTTTPTHCVIALEQALLDYLEEGGLKGRNARYCKNRDTLKYGMKRLGFRQILDEKYHNSCVLTNFAYLDDSKFDINIFYKKLTERGQIINPHKFTDTNAFRIGTIGHLFEKDFEKLLKEIENVLIDMGVTLDN